VHRRGQLRDQRVFFLLTELIEALVAEQGRGGARDVLVGRAQELGQARGGRGAITFADAQARAEHEELRLRAQVRAVADGFVERLVQRAGAGRFRGFAQRLSLLEDLVDREVDRGVRALVQRAREILRVLRRRGGERNEETERESDGTEHRVDFQTGEVCFGSGRCAAEPRWSESSYSTIRRRDGSGMN
jgi:hypothetical protein